jgi:hypothetical protein
MPDNPSSSSPSPVSIKEFKRPPLAIHSFPAELAFWSYAGFGAAIAGGLFGAYCGFLGNGSLGLMFGFGFALVAAFPVFLTVGIVTWGLWLSRVRMLTAALAGAMTLFASVKYLESVSK